MGRSPPGPSEVDWAEVTSYVTESYRLTAPKRFAALINEPHG